MDSCWPDNAIATRASKRKEGNKGKDPMRRKYPSVESGKIGAATLVDRNGRLEWTTILNHNEDAPKLVSKAPVMVFPSTRPFPVQIPKMTSLRRAELAANFLRAHLPDVDIATKLIKENLAEDSQEEQNLKLFDPYAGNLLELLAGSSTLSKKTKLLAFPTGVLNRDLNVSTLVLQEDSTIFRPAASSVRSFDTPIQQIVSIPGYMPLLAVRTFGSTSFLEIKWNGQVRDLAEVKGSDVGHHQIVDLKPFSSPLQTLFVNDYGAVFSIRVGEQLNAQALSNATAEPTDHFWRLGECEDPNSFLLCSRNRLQQNDSRVASGSVVNLFHLAESSRDVIASLETQQSDRIARLVSTNQIVWIDCRMPGKTLLGYNHQRRWDRTLESRTLLLGGSSMTLVTSRRNGLVTIYDVARSKDGLLHLEKQPFRFHHSLPAADGPFTGHALFHNSLKGGMQEMALFSLSQRGSVYRLDLGLSAIVSQKLDWSTDMNNLARRAQEWRPDMGKLGAREKTEVTFSPFYHDLFISSRQQERADEESDAEAVYDLIDQVPLLWQNSSAPIEHMLTTYDVLFRSGDEPNHPTRADFLTGSLINSTRGYRAFAQGRLSTEKMKTPIIWHLDLRAVLKHLDCEIADDVTAVAEDLQRFDVSVHSEPSGELKQREEEARQQLALDLILSSDIFSPQSFSKPTPLDDTLETMTESMSLGSEPALVEFQYLHPVLKRDNYQQEESKSICPVGVRLLMKDWDVGMNPDQFKYESPYEFKKEVPNSLVKEQPVMISQPPLVVATSKNNTVLNSRKLASESQPSFPNPFSASQPLEQSGDGIYSQEPMTSTQILPGPFGGRTGTKKKSQKKRMGGF